MWTPPWLPVLAAGLMSTNNCVRKSMRPVQDAPGLAGGAQAPHLQNFSNNAPTWEDLETQLAQREAELGCAPEDSETVRLLLTELSAAADGQNLQRFPSTTPKPLFHAPTGRFDHAAKKASHPHDCAPVPLKPGASQNVMARRALRTRPH